MLVQNEKHSSHINLKNLFCKHLKVKKKTLMQESSNTVNICYVKVFSSIFPIFGKRFLQSKQNVYAYIFFFYFYQIYEV